MPYSILYRTASVTEFQPNLTVVAVDDMALSPVGAGAGGRGSMGLVLVALANMVAALVALASMVAALVVHGNVVTGMVPDGLP